jgi:cell division GTPase FtsZ
MKALVIGVGAAGNKCAIDLLEHNTIGKDDIVLINSTLKDVPESYREKAIEIEGPDGCGQDRSLAKDIVLQAMQKGKLVLDNMMNPDHDKVIIIASLCGATGSGMVPVIGAYFSKVLSVPVEIIGLVGFEDESARAMRNILEFCQDMDEKFTIQLVKNSAFLKAANNNRSKAEKLANLEVVKRVNTMLGNYMIDSEQNIDDTDIKKLNNISGYKTVEFYKLEDKIKSMDQFNSILKEMLDDSKSIESDGSTLGRLGVIINAQSSSQEFIDRSYSVLKERLGNPYEIYTHIQYSKNAPEFIAVIASGMKMPDEEIKEYYEKYKEMTEAVNKKKDSFFAEIQDLKGNSEDSKFDSFSSGRGYNTEIEASAAEKNKFFASFLKDTEPVTSKKGDNSSNNKGF